MRKHLIPLLSCILIFSPNAYTQQEESIAVTSPVDPNTVIGNGAGTVNNVSKWLTATTQGVSSIFDDGTNVTFTEPLVSTQGSIAVSNAFINHTATWSGVGTYDDILTNITDSGPSNAASTLINLKVGSVSQFSVTKAGIGNFAGALTTGGGITTSAGNITAFAQVIAGSSSALRWTSRTQLLSPASGQFQIQNNTSNANISFQTGTSSAKPTIGTGFGTSPAVTTHSTDTAGSINVGTGGAVLTGTINFTQTWNSSAVFCIVQDSTGFIPTHATASTTVLTITASANWAASSVIVWHCIGSTSS